MAAIKGEKALIQLAQDFDVDPNHIKQWQDQLFEGATGVFGEAPKADPEPAVDVNTLHAKIGALTLENVFCSARDALRGKRHRFELTAEGSATERKKMIDLTSRLSVKPPGYCAGDLAPGTSSTRDRH